MAEPDVRAQIVVHGRVQGVYYRASLKKQADAQGLRGWVRNRPDGSVEASIQGTRAAVDGLIVWVRKGPRGAIVESVDVEWMPLEILASGFHVVG